MRKSSSQFTVYTIEVTVGEDAEMHTVYRRFREFVALDKKLRTEISDGVSLPSKRWWGSLKRKVVLERIKVSDMVQHYVKWMSMTCVCVCILHF